MTSDPEIPAYQGLAAHYDELFGPETARARLNTFEWIVEHYGLHFRSAVDVGCGTGTFVQYLLRTGVPRVWGVDRSPEMLARAVSKNIENAGRFLRQDLRELRLPEPVDLVTCQFETLNYLITDDDLHTAFTRFAGALTPGGNAVFDVAARRPVTPEPGDGIELTEFADHAVTIRARYDTGRALQVARVILASGADPTATRSEEHIQRIHSIADVTAALRGSGLVLRAMHDSADVSRPAELADSVIVLAQRAG